MYQSAPNGSAWKIRSTPRRSLWVWVGYIVTPPINPARETYACSCEVTHPDRDLDHGIGLGAGSPDRHNPARAKRLLSAGRIVGAQDAGRSRHGRVEARDRDPVRAGARDTLAERLLLA